MNAQTKDCTCVWLAVRRVGVVLLTCSARQKAKEANRCDRISKRSGDNWILKNYFEIVIGYTWIYT